MKLTFASGLTENQVEMLQLSLLFSSFSRGWMEVGLIERGGGLITKPDHQRGSGGRFRVGGVMERGGS